MKPVCFVSLFLVVLLLPGLATADNSGLAGVEFSETTDLSDAVERFNAQVNRISKVGRAQPPLTVDEIVASIRAWDRKQNPIDPGLLAVFHQIAETQTLPADSAIMFTQGWTPNGDYEFTVWWVDICLYYPRPDREDSKYVYVHRIRDRTISSRPRQKRIAVDSGLLTLPERERLAAKHFAAFISGADAKQSSDHKAENRNTHSRGN
ncbi:hypothetical protein [Gimesia chilikensis]|jgi:hypothetical protein|uniref:Uncharacterized protein n=1 Tax=Gimesia chilikensis TaxID=2605989 RepID=A0A517PRB5_9PLAN|nr:hypothetical protein [Gimesia chilikensis]QDT21923.1 hypothetical protein HG66A1_37280 [Gimesia chilikensis]